MLSCMNEDKHLMQSSRKMFSLEASIWRERYLMKSLEKKWIQRYSRDI